MDGCLLAGLKAASLTCTILAIGAQLPVLQMAALSHGRACSGHCEMCLERPRSQSSFNMLKLAPPKFFHKLFHKLFRTKTRVPVRGGGGGGIPFIYHILDVSILPHPLLLPVQSA